MPKDRPTHSRLTILSSGLAGFFAKYSWVIVKNVVGWILMLTALLVAGIVPAPLGTPLFLIGFALITFPGKRRVTSRVLRGIPIRLHTRSARLGRLAAALLMPPIAVALLAHRRHPILHPSQMALLPLCALYALAILAAWIITWLFLLLLNAIIKFAPRMRRRIRPWLKRHGINLLPPRKKRRGRSFPSSPANPEILEIDIGRRAKKWRKLLRL